MANLFTRASAALDRSAVRLLERRIAPRAPRLAAGDRARMVEIAAAYRDAGDRCFPVPALPGPTLSARGEGPLGTQVVDLAFASDHAPFLPAAREPYARARANHTVHARWWTSGRGRPTLLAIHGWGGGAHWVSERTFAVARWLREGYDVAALVLPHHAERAGGVAWRWPSADPVLTNDGFAQAILDARALATWLRSRGSSAIAALGMSLGGYVTALWAGLAGPGEPGGLDAAIAMIPAVDMAALMWRHGEHGPLVRAAARHGIDEALLAEIYAVHAPLSRPPRLARERLAVIAGRGDRITPPDQAAQLAAHWGVEVAWFDGGHLAQVGRGDALRGVRDQLAALEFPGREPRR